MKNFPLLFLSMLIGCVAYSQELSKSINKENTKVESTFNGDKAFETYCLQNAASIVQLPDTKANQFEIAGSVEPSTKKTATYQDYGVSIKENETQYFLINGTSNLLKVESLYRLRASYTQSLQKR